jgi:hypothetical protein
MANVFLYEALPVDVVGNVGSEVSLSSILTAAFGSNWGGYTEFWLAYYGANTLAEWDFSYWNPSNPSVSGWLEGGTAITAATASSFNQAFLTSAQVPNYSLQLGNEIAPLVFLTVPVSTGSGTPTEYIQYEINVVDPSLQGIPHGPSGEPTPADIVASAELYAAAYSGVLNNNDCAFIAEDVAAAAGAVLDDAVTESLNPNSNQNNGFWQVVYRGSGPDPITDWQTLVQPGDIVRMGWIGGGQHTTIVLSVNSNGSITVFDNDDYNSLGQEDIGIHTVNYDTETIPTTITIYRLTDASGLLGTLSLQQQTELIYIGYYNRSADAGGFSFWEGQDASAQAGGQSAAVALTNIANSFTPQAETQALYPFLSNPNPNFSDPTVQAGLTTFIGNVYGNLFGHAADSGGLAYWLGQIESGAVGLGAAVLAVANGAQGSDATILKNKIAVALDFTNLTAAADVPTTSALVAEAKTVLAGVDGLSFNDASVTTAEALIQPWIASHPNGALVAVVGSAAHFELT